MSRNDNWQAVNASLDGQFKLGNGLRAHLARYLSAFEVRECHDPQLRRAAVALVVTALREGEEAAILVTLRSALLKRHAGQFALPGGRLDEGETTFDAARRELHEELGIDLGETDLLGRLDDYPTRSGFRIAPLVFWGGAGLRIVPDATEVEQVFHVPLHELNGPGLPILEMAKHSDHPVLSSKLPSIGHQMFAPTAAMLYQFREVALRGGSTRVAHFGQPEFAWE